MFDNIKGIHSCKSMQRVAKSGIPDKKESDSIKLYLYEKEMARLNVEKIKILQRLKMIEDRLTEIQAYNNEKAKHMYISPQQDLHHDVPEAEFRTLSIDY